MSHVGRLWIELEIGSDGPSGTARDEAGRIARFSGWLELIAVIEAPHPRDERPIGEATEATK
jgi:hypothetical protein